MFDESEQDMSWSFRALVLGTIAVVSFGAGLFYSMHARADEEIVIAASAPKRAKKAPSKASRARRKAAPRAEGQPYVKTLPGGKRAVDFEGLSITGELRNPGEFYFQRKTDEKFDSLVKRRKNFHREMLRDVVMAK